MTERVAAVDCGTNSLRLLVADVDLAGGTLRDVDRRLEVVRLGEGVDATGLIAPAAMSRALVVIGDYAARCRETGVQRLRFVATSATRDAGNRDVFTSAVRDLLGVTPEVIDGREEAALSFAGATRGLPGRVGGAVLVVDLGGGSTEFVLGQERVDAALSLDIGSVRLTERHLPGDPPSSAQVAAARADVDAALDRVAVAMDLARADTLVGVAGTVATITAHALRLTGYDSGRVHGARLPVDVVVTVCDELITANRDERAALPYLHPGRVDVIGAGALIWREVVRRVATVAGLTEVATSEHDLLDGIAWRLAAEAQTLR
jgi:exopolyphosphatase/guanosine-5'-triphosphate,3'-diphosphate pyrophosphatase